MATALRISPDIQDLEEDWDPQGLNSIDKDVLESFSEEEDEVDKGVSRMAMSAGDGADELTDELNLDGLKELEEMERLLKSEESPLDFAMVAEEE